MQKLKTPDNNSDYVQEVYHVVGRIPKGKVATYAQVATVVTEELKRKNIKKRVNSRYMIGKQKNCLNGRRYILKES